VQVTIRELKPDETGLLETFLYEAIFIPTGTQPPPQDIIYLPEVYIYIKDFGGKDDACLVAEIDGEVCGAVWTRIIPAYGHVDEDTPEFAIALLPEYRGRGVGGELMRKMLDLLREKGYTRASLAVQKLNPAYRLYQRCGFAVIEEKGEEYIMTCDLGNG